MIYQYQNDLSGDIVNSLTQITLNTNLANNTTDQVLKQRYEQNIESKYFKANNLNY